MLVWGILKKPPVASSYLGIALGIGGMYLLISQDYITSKENSWLGITAIITSMCAWGYSSVYVKKADMPKGQAQSAAVQMLAGSVALLIFSFFIEQPLAFKMSSISVRSYWALAFLIVLGSALAFSAFNYLLQHISPEKVATATYVNPIVAMLAGWMIGGEMLTIQSMVAAAIMLSGVLFINVDIFDLFKKKKKAQINIS